MDIRIPRLGEGADSGTVVNILVKEGDRVKKDQTLLEIENEKAVAPIPSTADGVVSKILIKVGDKVSVGQAVVSLGGSNESSVPQASTPQPAKSQQAYTVPTVQPIMQVAPAGQAFNAQPAASPSVRKMAQDLGIDLRRVQGTESGGRISLADLRNYVLALQQLALNPPASVAQVSAPSASKPASESIDFSKWGKVEKKAMSSLRQKISQKMLESWTTIPHVTQFDEADITGVMALRKKYEEKYAKKGTKLTLTSFVLKACVAALKKYPEVNISVDDNTQEIVTKNYYHLGVAVDTEAGLIVPVLRDVDKKSLLEISKELEVLAEKTRARKVSAEELKGGCFTVSNLGGIGGSHFTPIINKPEAAILGVGRGKGTLPLSLSYDHRVIDGALGARFIREISIALEKFKESDVKI